MEEHPWRTMAWTDRYVIKWCPYCGAFQKEAMEKHDGVHSYITYPQNWTPRTCREMQRNVRAN